MVLLHICFWALYHNNEMIYWTRYLLKWNSHIFLLLRSKTVAIYFQVYLWSLSHLCWKAGHMLSYSEPAYHKNAELCEGKYVFRVWCLFHYSTLLYISVRDSNIQPFCCRVTLLGIYVRQKLIIINKNMNLLYGLMKWDNLSFYWKYVYCSIYMAGMCTPSLWLYWIYFSKSKFSPPIKPIWTAYSYNIYGSKTIHSCSNFQHRSTQ